MIAPFIGITTAVRTDRRGKPDEVERVIVGRGYLRAVLRAGGIPILLPTDGGDELLRRIIDDLDAVVFSGGEDIQPERYGEQPSPALGITSKARDDFELALFDMAKQRSIPVLGVCRGMQLLNVAHGGTLIQHIPDELKHADQHHDTESEPRPWKLRVHEVTVEPDTMLHNVLQADTMLANSLHHQAVKVVGSGLIVCARSPDGVIEAIEGTGDHWLLGVQWHPEVFEEDEAVDRHLFDGLVAAAQARRREMQKR